MRHLLLLTALLVSPWLRAASAPNDARFEDEIRAATQSERVTVVHFWASWCSNCRSEHRDDGWREFIRSHPDVQVIFISIWGSAEDDRAQLERYGLTELPNFVAHRHPNQARRRGERLERFLDLPITWVPTTWVFREGKLRFAFNYGEIRFDILSQLVADTQAGW